MKKLIYLLAICATVALTSCQKTKTGTVAFYTTAQITAPVKIYVNETYKAQVIYSLNYTPDCANPYTVKIDLPEGNYRVKAITGNIEVNYNIKWEGDNCYVFNL